MCAILIGSVSMHLYGVVIEESIRGIVYADLEVIGNAHWRSMQALASLCLAYGTGKASLEGFSCHDLLAVQLRWLTATDTAQVRTRCGCTSAANVSQLYKCNYINFTEMLCTSDASSSVNALL